MAQLELLPPYACIFDMVVPSWVVDQAVVDRACALWQSLPAGDRLFINSIFHDARVLRGFLTAPGSCNHHHAHDGGCILHSVETAEFASSIARDKPHLDRNLLVTTALVHDSGKAMEYVRTRNGRWRISEYGRHIGHKIGGIQLATLAASRVRGMNSRRKQALFHMLACSYAPGWVGLRAPSTPEAAVLAAIDRVSAEAGRGLSA